MYTDEVIVNDGDKASAEQTRQVMSEAKKKFMSLSAAQKKKYLEENPAGSRTGNAVRGAEIPGGSVDVGSSSKSIDGPQQLDDFSDQQKKLIAGTQKKPVAKTYTPAKEQYKKIIGGIKKKQEANSTVETTDPQKETESIKERFDSSGLVKAKFVGEPDSKKEAEPETKYPRMGGGFVNMATAKKEINNDNTEKENYDGTEFAKTVEKDIEIQQESGGSANQQQLKAMKIAERLKKIRSGIEKPTSKDEVKRLQEEMKNLQNKYMR